MTTISSPSQQTCTPPADVICMRAAANALRAAQSEDRSYAHAAHNTRLLQAALDALEPGQCLQLPVGLFDVETLWLTGKRGITVRAAQPGQTILRRAAFAWDNDWDRPHDGACPILTEVLRVGDSQDLTLEGLVLDGNSHQMAIKGKGRFDPLTGKILAGFPQFPNFVDAATGQRTSSSMVLHVVRCTGATIRRCRFEHAFRWCIEAAHVHDFLFERNVIHTGRLSSEYKGHRDPAPNDQVMHAHTSQDGLHLVNVQRGVIEYNTILSEDSAIAVEANPRYDWQGHHRTCDIRIGYNFLSTNSPARDQGLLDDQGEIFGTGLASQWSGQSGVDIFYNERWDEPGQLEVSGPTALLHDIRVYRNCIHEARYGVRCGFFIGSNAYDNDQYRHRVRNVVIEENNEQWMTGHEQDQAGGLRFLRKNSFTGSYSLSGGVGVAVRNTDGIVIRANQIQNVHGGTGIDVGRCHQIRIEDNQIEEVHGRELADEKPWPGGWGIHVWRQLPSEGPLPTLDQPFEQAESLIVHNNQIHQTDQCPIRIEFETH